MKKMLVISVSLLFLSHTALIANEEAPHPGGTYEQTSTNENSEQIEKNAPTDEELEAKREAAEASEVAHAEEMELREVGAGEEEPIIEE